MLQHSCEAGGFLRKSINLPLDEAALWGIGPDKAHYSTFRFVASARFDFPPHPPPSPTRFASGSAEREPKMFSSMQAETNHSPSIMSFLR
jgi:hypothetical protein